MSTTQRRALAQDGVGRGKGKGKGKGIAVRLDVLRTSPARPGSPTFWRELRSLAPVLAVVLVLLVTARVYYVRWGFEHRAWGGQTQPSTVPDWLAFNDLGVKWATRAGLGDQAVAPVGYDGQYYYYMARDPSVIVACARSESRCPIDASPLREERILFPMTALLLALGDPEMLHVALFALDFLSILLTALIVGTLAVEAGASRWLGVAAAIFAGELLGLLRDLADPFAILWLVLAVYALRRDRPLWCGLAIGAAVLTREQLIVMLPFFAIPWLARHNWRATLTFALPALVPFAAWQVTLRLLFHQWGLGGSVATTRGLRWPFLGLWEVRANPEFPFTVAFVAVPLLAAAVIAVLWLRRHGPRALLRDPVPLIVLVYALLATLTHRAEWEDTWASARLIAPIAALAVLVACRVAPLPRYAFAALLCLTALTPYLIPPTLY